MGRFDDNPMQREHCRLNPGSSLSSGLLAAYLGPNWMAPAGTTLFEDSGPLQNQGTLSGYTSAGDLPTDMWQFDPTICRWWLNTDAVNDYVWFKNSLIGCTTYSISAWIKPVSGSYCIFWDGRAATAATNNLVVYTDSGNSNRLTHALINTGGVTGTKNLGNAIHHVAVRSLPISPYAELYVDGIKEALTVSTITGVVTITGAANASFGASLPTATSYWPGYVGDLMWWNRALSPEEISVLANPADVMLGDLILPRSRRIWPGFTEAATPTTIELPLMQLSI